MQSSLGTEETLSAALDRGRGPRIQISCSRRFKITRRRGHEIYGSCGAISRREVGLSCSARDLEPRPALLHFLGGALVRSELRWPEPWLDGEGRK
jgi:hypothetical protein